MKYVIFKKDGELVPVLISDHTTHADVTLKEAERVSAGHWCVDPSGQVMITEHKSGSTGLEPLPGDREILDLFYKIAHS